MQAALHPICKRGPKLGHVSRLFSPRHMDHLVIWAGPVWAGILADAALPVPTKLLTFASYAGGIGSGSFSALGRDVGGDLGTLCERGGYDITHAKTVTVAVFSAGWGLAEQLLRNEASRARVNALVAADAYYTGQGLGRKPGYAAFCQRAIDRRALAVFSTSTNEGPGYPSSQEAVGALLEPWTLAPSAIPAALPTPDAALAAGSLLWLQYGQRLGTGEKNHSRHATRVAPAVVSHLVTPYLQRVASALPGQLVAALGILLAAGAWAKVG